MAHAPSLARHVKAAGILERQECTPVDDLPGLWHVTDSGTGSGRIHVTSTSRCDCPDHNFRGNVCKHITAVQRAEAELATYAASWDTKAATQQAYTVARATGATEQRAYADALKAAKGMGADVTTAITYANAAHKADQGPCCPMCGGSVSIQNAYIGGKGYQLFSICDGEGCRHVRPA